MSNDAPANPPAPGADEVSAIEPQMPAGGADPSELAPTARAANMGRVVGSGMTWMILATLLTKAMTFVAQWVLGHQLAYEDFAVYASATALAGFLMICREAGVRELLVQRGPGQYEDLAGPGFWLALTYNIAAACLIAALAIPLARWKGQQDLAPMLWVMAVALPLGTAGGILQNRLRMELRFRELSTRVLVSSGARQLSSIIFALVGLGAMSFAWPVLVAAVIDTITGFLSTRDTLWRRPAQVHRWPGLLRDTRWLMYASLASFMVDYGPFLLLGAVVPVSDVQAGFFTFAYLMSAQVGVLLAFNLLIVLTPALARLNQEPERQAQAALKALRTLMLAGSIGSLGLAAIFAPAERFLWGGKWEQAVFSVILQGAFFPWRVTFGVCSALLQAQGRFRLYAFMMSMEGLGLILATVVGGFIEPTSDMMSWFAGIFLMASRLGITVWLLNRIGVRKRDVLGAMLPGWTIAVVGASAGIAAEWFTPLHSLVGGVLSGVPTVWAMRIADALGVMLAGGVCVVTFTILARVFLKSHVEEAVTVAPARVRARLSWLLRVSVPE